MRVLVIGGSGYVGGLTLPRLSEAVDVSVYDLRPPENAKLESTQGSVEDYDAMRRAMEDRDALLYMAMGRKEPWGSVESIRSAFDVSVKGVYLALKAAHEAGISHAVYTSSMSVYADLGNRYFPDEKIPPDATEFYGFTKRLGEEACRNAAREWGMSVNALRLCLPTPDERWHKEHLDGKPTIATAASDVARALQAALERRFGGFEPYMVSGDYTRKWMDMSKAKRLLDWEPLARPAGV